MGVAPMTLLEAVAIALDELETLSRIDGDEVGFEVTIGGGQTLTIRYFYDAGEAAAAVTMPDLLIVNRQGLTTEEELRAIARGARDAAKTATPW